MKETTRLLVKKQGGKQRSGECENCERKIYISKRYNPYSYTYCPHCGRPFESVVLLYDESRRETEEDPSHPYAESVMMGERRDEK